MTAEEIRDQALHVSGLLSDKMYGPGVMPPQPDGIWEHAYRATFSEGEDRYRRGIYTYLKRTSPYPSMITLMGRGGLFGEAFSNHTSLCDHERSRLFGSGEFG